MILEAIALIIGIAAIPFIEGFRIGLRDELKPSRGYEQERPILDIPTKRMDKPIVDDSIEVLVSLGYPKQKSKEIIKRISQENTFESIQDLVKAALKQCAA